MIEVMVEVFARLLNKSEAHSIYLIHLIYFRTAFKNRAVSPEGATVPRQVMKHVVRNPCKEMF